MKTTQLQNELTDVERAELAHWEAVNCGRGGKSPSDWPGWADIAVRVANDQSNNGFRTISNYSYFLAMVIVYFSAVYVMFAGIFMDTKIANDNFAGFACAVYLLMFLHAIAKLPVFRRKLREVRK